MPMTNAGRDALAGLAVGIGTDFSNANAHLAVGDSTVAFAAGQTDLIGTNKFRNPVDAGYPTRSANVLSFQSTFAGTDANFAWNEWGIANAATAGDLLNRVVEYNGTKQPGQTWIFEVDITINLA